MKSAAKPDTRSEHKNASPQKSLRSDGQQARLRLLDTGLTLFADKGFAQTALVNLAAIRYDFGDKEGLYRAVLTDPRYNPRPDAQALVTTPADIRNEPPGAGAHFVPAPATGIS